MNTTYQAEPSILPVATDTLSQLRTVANVLAPDLSDQELQLFAMVAARSGLDPFARQIYAVKRKGRVTFQTGIDGYRSIAVRTGEYDGQDEPEFGPTIDNHPEYATVRVYRKGMSRAVAATAHWAEYCPTDNDFMWRKMPHVMIAKVAEALALRKAFPWDPNRGQGIGADLYTADEMEQAETPPVRERLRARRETLAVASPAEPPADTSGAVLGALDETPPLATLSASAEAATETPAEESFGRPEFVALAKAAKVTKEQIEWAGETVAPGVKATLLTDAQWHDMAELLAILPENALAKFHEETRSGDADDL